MESTVYNENGNISEILTYESESQYNDNIDDYLSSEDTTGVLTISRYVYDNEERILVSVGPYNPSDNTTDDYPIGTEIVYDNMGRIIQERKWPCVSIEFEPILDSNSNVVGKKPAIEPANAWNGIGSAPTDIGWKSDGKLPVFKSVIGTNQAGPLSFSQKIYDIAGRIKHSICLDENACQQVTSYRYDSAGRQTAVIDPLGHFLDNPDNDLLETGIQLGDGITNVTQINFDSFNFSTYNEIDNPKGNLTGDHITETHFQANNRDYVIDAEGNKTEYTYNKDGQLSRIKHPETVFDQNLTPRNLYSHIFYDSQGQKKFETGPVEYEHASSVKASEFKQYKYDLKGRLTQVIMPQAEDPGSGPVHPQYSYFYDNYGNCVCTIDPLGRATITKYDYMHNPVKKYKPFLPLDQQSQPMEINSVTDVYAALNIALAWQRPPAFTIKEYDDHGRLTCDIDYKGTKKCFIYYTTADTGCLPGYLKKIEYYENIGTSGIPNWNSTPTEVTTYVFDKTGRQTQVKDTTDPGNEIILQTFSYDAEGRITSLTSPQGTINYQYSPITGRKTATWTGQPAAVITRTEFSYDQMGRLEETKLIRRDGIDLVNPEITCYNYNLNGSRDSFQLPNGIVTQYTYNSMNRLTDVINNHTDLQGTIILSSFNYSHQPDGMRTGVIEEFDNTENHNIIYQYDNLNRIIYESNYNENTNPDGYRSRYVYDLAGNRRERQVEVTNTNGTNTDTVTVDYCYNGQPDQLTKEVYSNRAFTAFLWNQKHVYAYADPSNTFTYKISGTNYKIGQIRAFFIGMPSVLSRHLYFLAIALLPAVFFSPLLLHFAKNLYIQVPKRRRLPVNIYRKCTCLLLAYMFLVGPFIHDLNADELEYTNLSSASWGQNGNVISYWYDTNGSLCYKIYADVTDVEIKSQAEIETYLSNNPSVNYDRYTYNLQNRLSGLDKKCTGGTEEIEYKYNPQGIRIEKIVDNVSTTYLIDPYNHTGYSQVQEEWSTGQSTPDVTYTIGDDVITQSDVSGVKHLLYDGHGSTRHVTDQSAQVTESYNYDSYGLLLQENPPQPGCASQQSANLLYAGQYFDTGSQHYYNRSRWYNPSNGRFNRPDDHPGSIQDPQSLHKYLYCHDNPTNAVDPNGQFILILNVLATMAKIGSAVIKYYPILRWGLALADIITVINLVMKAMTEGITSITVGEWTEFFLITGTFFFGGKLARTLAKGMLRRIMRLPAGVCKSFKRLGEYVCSKGIKVFYLDKIVRDYNKVEKVFERTLGVFDFIKINKYVEEPVILLYKGGRNVAVLLHEYCHALQWKKYVGFPSGHDWINFYNVFPDQLEAIAHFISDVFAK